MARIIKIQSKVFDGVIRCAIYENNYNNSYTKIQDLIKEAKKDFPYITDNNLEVVTYAGERIARHIGVEFNVTEGEENLKNYRVGALEPTYN